MKPSFLIFIEIVKLDTREMFSNHQIVKYNSIWLVTIVKVILKYSKEQLVIVYANDTDILSFLLHHYQNTPDLKDIFLTEMTEKSD